MTVSVFFNTVNAGVVNGQQLASSLGVVTASAKTAGVSFDELGALIVGVTKEGGEAGQNINNLANFLNKLPSKQAAQGLKAIGVEVADSKGKFRPIIDVLSDLKPKLDNMTESARTLAIQKIFPDAQARQGALVLLSQLDSVKDALEVNQETSGATEKAYQKIAATASVQFSLLKNTSVAILAELGSAILPVLQPLIVWLAQNLVPAVKQAVAAFQEWSPQMQTVAVAVAGFVAALGPALIIIGSVISVIGGLITAVGTIAGAFGSIVSVGPEIAVVAVVLGTLAAAGAALYEAWETDFGGIREFVSGVMQRLTVEWQVFLNYLNSDDVNNFITTLKDGFNDLQSTLEPAFQQISADFNSAFGDILNWWDTNGADIKQAAVTTFKAIASVVKSSLDAIRAYWKENGQDITESAKAAWDAVKSIVFGTVRTIGDIIKIVTASINGDWSKGWSAFKDIIRLNVVAGIAVLKGLGLLILTVLKGAFNLGFSIGAWVRQKAVELGNYLIQGLIDGIKNRAGELYDAAHTVISTAMTVFQSVPQVQSPSKVTTQIGEFITEGLAIGIEGKKSVAVAAAKKVSSEVIKAFKDAQKEFSKLAGASPQTVSTIQQTNRISDATGAQQEIIKLRGETGLNNGKTLPGSVGGTEAELSRLKARKQIIDDTFSSMQDVLESSRQLNESLNTDSPEFAKRLQDLESAGQIELYNLQQEIDLTGVKNVLDQQKIKNGYELKRIREQMANDGFSDEQIEAETQIVHLQQAQQLELQRILEIRKQVAAATDLQKGLDEQLSDAQRNGRELSEYEKTLKKLSEDFKDISPEQREQILNTARQVDAQKQFNEEYKKTYDFIRGALDVLTDRSTSFGEKMKKLFGGIADSFKKMLLDMTANALTSNIMGGGSGSASGGGFLNNIFKSIFGGGSGSSSGGGFGSGSQGNGIFSFANGGANSGMLTTTNEMAHQITLRDGTVVNDGLSGSGNIFSNLKNLFSKNEGGLFAPKGNLLNGGKTSALGGTLSGIGAIASTIGSFLPGKLGSVVSMAGTGLSIGAMFGPWGAAIGAGVGALLGLFGGDPKRKADKQENLPKLQSFFSDALQQLRDIGANKSAFYADPEGTFAKAVQLRAQIAAGGGVTFQSKKYSKIAQDQIQQKLAEADTIIADLSKIKDRAVRARDVDNRLQTSFATGVYMSSAFRDQYTDYKRRNGMLGGTFTGADTLPSMLARGEMVLNPSQIMQVKRNAGFDAFKGAGIPGYATGVYVPPTVSAPGVSASAVNSDSSGKQPLIINLHLSNSGIVESEIVDAFVEGMDRNDVQVKIVKTYDKTKRRLGNNTD